MLELKGQFKRWARSETLSPFADEAIKVGKSIRIFS